MTAQKGREFILEVNDGNGYKPVGGFRSNSFTINGETIDVTSKDSNGYRMLLEDAGIVSISTSGSGVFVGGDEFGLVHSKMFAQQHVDCRLTVPGFKIYTGNFAISLFEMSGEHNGEVTYSISLESSGPITHVAA